MNIDGILVSVIVPVYNVEQYLDRCIDSIVRQTHCNIQIILVDDGSFDKSPQICDRWEQRDSRIIVVHKNNGGQSEARNYGLDIAVGEYILFVDSDDYIDENLVEDLLKEAVYRLADVVIARHQKTNGVKDLPFTGDVVEGSGVEILALMLNKYDWAPWGKLFKSSLFKNLRFIQGIIYEDFELMPRIMLSCSKAVFYNKSYYYYFVDRPDSTMGIIGKNKYTSDFIMVSEMTITLFETLDKEKSSIMLALLYRKILRHLLIQFEPNGNIADQQFKKKLKKMLHNNIRKIMVNKELDFKFKIAYFCMTYMGRLFGIAAYCRNTIHMKKMKFEIGQ